jgi:cytochrome P450
MSKEVHVGDQAEEVRRLASEFTFEGQTVTEAQMHELFERMRGVCPVAKSDAIDDGTYLVSRYADIQRCFRDPATFVSSVGRYPGEPKEIPVGIDPPFHTLARKDLHRPFALPNVRKHADELTQRARSYLEPIVARGEGDLQKEFTEPFPCVSFMVLLGAPLTDLDQLVEWKNILFSAGDNHDPKHRRYVVEELQPAMTAYFTGLILDRQKLPADERPDDLLTALAGAQIGDRPYSLEEQVSVCRFLIKAGLDTVTGMLARMLRFLAESPAHRRELLADRKLVPDAVEEMLRYFSSVTPYRIATTDVEVGGVLVRANERLEFSLPSAGRDESVYENADVIDFRRPHVAHLAFGTGAHRCLGSHLARIELEIGIQAVLDLMPDYYLDDRYPPPQVKMSHVLTPDHLHVVIGSPGE